MRISWRELDWISERDRHEIERRMHVLGGASGLLDRVDFTGRSPSASGAVEIRITANAAKRQIIAVRRDPQRVKAFNSAFEALERSVTSVLKTQPAKPQAQAERAAAPRASAATRPALTLSETPQHSWIGRRGTRAALAVAITGAVTALALLVLWLQRGPSEVDVGARAEVAAFSAVAKLPAEARSSETRSSETRSSETRSSETRSSGTRSSGTRSSGTRREGEPAFSAIARLSTSQR